jgi:hypothetical protein
MLALQQHVTYSCIAVICTGAPAYVVVAVIYT